MLIEKLLKVALLGSSWVMYLMLALSVFSIGAIAERYWFFFKHRGNLAELTEKFLAMLERGEDRGARELLRKSKTIEAQVIEPALRFLPGGPDAVQDAVESELVNARLEMERGTTLLGTLGNNAPFIGLFGTIIGVIIAFQNLATTQANGAMGSVMAGIAEALVATAVGLFVAIPAVVAFNVIQKRISEIESNVTAITKSITAILKAEAQGMELGRSSVPAKLTLAAGA
ncbi:MAG: MotA/TolQ/ExbB proton channel family protein [Polyangiaceae bacterium]